ALDAFQHPLAERLKLRAAMVDGRQRDCPQDTIGYGCRSGDLQKMAAGATRHIRHQTISPARQWGAMGCCAFRCLYAIDGPEFKPYGPVLGKPDERARTRQSRPRRAAPPRD